MRVRKINPGSSSHGHVWDEPGQVLDVPAEDAADLVRVAPHEFEVLPDEPETPEDPPPPPADDDNPPEKDPEPEPEAVKEPVTEPAPEPEPEPEPAETKKPPARRGGRRVTED